MLNLKFWLAASIVVIAITFTGCSSSPTLTEDVAKLAGEKIALETEIQSLQNKADGLKLTVDTRGRELSNINARVASLMEDENVMKVYAAGGSMRYILSVTLKQSKFSLSVKEHLKNSMNAETFDIFVDKITYDNANTGDDLFKAFRVGSFVFNGSVGNWKIVVNSKRMVSVPGVEK